MRNDLICPTLPARLLPFVACSVRCSRLDVADGCLESLDPKAITRLLHVGGVGLVSQLITLFVEQAEQAVGVMRSHTQSSHVAIPPEALERLAHSLSGSAGQIGATRLSELATSIETAAARRLVNVSAVRELCAEYDHVARQLCDLKTACDAD